MMGGVLGPQLSAKHKQEAGWVTKANFQEPTPVSLHFQKVPQPFPAVPPLSGPSVQTQKPKRDTLHSNHFT